MKARYRLIRRGIRGGVFYSVDTKTGRRTSLGTANPDEAAQIIEAKNIAERQPVLNLQIAKAYLAGTDSGLTTRTWQQAMETLMEGKQGANRERWSRVATDRALAPLLPRTIVDTPGELMLKVLQSGTVSTNVFLRRLHNFCLDMNWLAWPLVPKRQWPAVRYKDKRAITWEEHCKIIEREKNPERKAFYQLAWHVGASQSDLAHLQAEDVDWQARIICFFRMKTRWRGLQPPQIRFGKEVEAILATLPKSGPLFPYGYVVRGYLGVETQDLTPELATEFELHDATGVLVGGVSPNGPAEQAGLEVGDVISRFDGKEVLGARQLMLSVAEAKPGQIVPVEVLRDGSSKLLRVTIGNASSKSLLAKVDRAAHERNPGALHGVFIGELNSELRQQLEIPNDVQGAFVFDLHAASAAAQAGLRPGDVIQSINRQEVRNAGEASRLTQNAVDKRTLLRVWSNSGSHFVLIEDLEP